ncbi:hypothetical protein [Comamonas serinivorans]
MLARSASMELTSGQPVAYRAALSDGRTKVANVQGLWHASMGDATE